jgi:CubicO group peptidase (beta-lactamase class C family)
MQYADVADAGFSPSALADARRFWEKRGAAAFLAVSGGAVVASWGDVGRRFMIHSIRKSLLSALYGVFRDEIDLTLTLGELEIDDVSALTDQEKQARVVQLLQSRSGVYHPAAAEPMEMSADRPDRGDHLPGTRWWYNNWDFNVAGTVFRQLTGADIFEAFAETIAEPIGMQDYRVTDGFYHYERDKSFHPAYSFRMSTRDLARLGLLFAREGRWRNDHILPRSWVAESTQPHSEIDVGEEYGTGYGYMWWIEGTRGFTARGYGGHVLAVYPGLDLVMVIRADTFNDRYVSNRAIARLFDMVIRAGGGERSEAPRLYPLPTNPARVVPTVALSSEQLARYTFEMILESGRTVRVAPSGGVLTIDYGLGHYRLLPESETRLRMEDAEHPVVFELDAGGRLIDVWTEQLAYLEAAAAARRGEPEVAVAWVTGAAEKFPESARAHYNLARALSGIGETGDAMEHLRLALDIDPDYRAASHFMRSLQFRRYAWLVGLTGVFLVVVVWVARLRRNGARRRGT